MSELKYEKILEDAGEKLRLLMEKCTPEQKKQLAKTLKEIEEFTIKAEKEGKHFEKTSLFAAVLVSTPGLSDEMKKAASDFITADYNYVRELAGENPDEPVENK